jgi:hypothetical protein
VIRRDLISAADFLHSSRAPGTATGTSEQRPLDESPLGAESERDYIVVAIARPFNREAPSRSCVVGFVDYCSIFLGAGRRCGRVQIYVIG